MLHLPVTEAPFVSEVLPSWGRWLEAGVRDEYWDQLSYGARRCNVAVPGLHIGGWFDLFLGGTLDRSRR
jgi:predicted acyl esterase